MKKILFGGCIAMTILDLVAVNIAADRNEMGMCSVFLMGLVVLGVGLAETCPEGLKARLDRMIWG